MQWISISDYSIIYGFFEKQSPTDTISRIYKKNIVETADSVFFLKEVVKTLKGILSGLEKESSADKRIAISLPVNKSRIFSNMIKEDLTEEEITNLLNWKIANSLPDNDKLHIQHYPVENENGDNSEFFSVITEKNFRDEITRTVMKHGFKPLIMDLGIFSAYHLLNASFPLNAYSGWGLWQMGKENDPQNLLLFENGTFAFLSFTLHDNDEIIIHQNTAAGVIDAEYIKTILSKEYNRLNIDKMFVYSNNPTNVFVQEHISADQNILLNPLPVFTTQKVQMENKYLTNKYMISQFSEIAGLIARVA